MRLAMQIRLPVEPFNTYLRDRTAGQKLLQILDEIRPEVAYFTEQGAQRGIFMVVNVEDSAQVPALAEPFFLVFEADVEFHIAMTPEDLARSDLDGLAERYA